MILPIVAYGDPVLRKVAEEIDEHYAGLPKLIDDMFETMYSSSGVGLAAPQIGKSIRLFIVDGEGYSDEEPELATFKKVFINPIIIEEKGEPFAFNEGCLSIPGIREDVMRKPEVTLEYYDEQWQLHEETFSGIAARIIQHEYDHIEGILFIDHVTPLTKKLIKAKLERITRGDVKVNYRMRFARR